METSRLDRLDLPPVGPPACRERVVAQTMPFLEQQQSSIPELFKVDRLPDRERMIAWHRYFEGVLKQRSPFDIPAIVGEREQHYIEPSRVQPFDEPRRQVLDQVKPECGIAAAQPEQHVGQQKWTDGWDHTHPQGAAERLAIGPGGFRELFAFLEYSPRPLDDCEPERGQYAARPKWL
jgi:hypothetical protein